MPETVINILKARTRVSRSGLKSNVNKYDSSVNIPVTSQQLYRNYRCPSKKPKLQKSWFINRPIKFCSNDRGIFLKQNMAHLTTFCVKLLLINSSFCS